MAKVSRAHADVGPELRRLAQVILDGIDPAVRAAVTLASSAAAGQGPGKCQQVWCPVCALAAVVNGEQHPLVTVIAEHSVALLDVIRAIVDDVSQSDGQSGDQSTTATPDDDPSEGGLTTEALVRNTNGDGAAKSPNGDGAAKARYQVIPVTLQD